ncbi:MAG: hypothetical protein QOC92_4169 [Acidimicrobiaceae bacterium]
MGRQRVRVLALLVGFIAISACSSYERIGTEGSGVARRSASAAADQAGAGVEVGEGASAPRAGSTGTGTAAGAAQRSAGATVGADGSPTDTAARDCTVKVGVTYSSDVNAALAGAGNPSAATEYGNYVKALQAEYQAGADYLNSQGGFGGCKVELAY